MLHTGVGPVFRMVSFLPGMSFAIPVFEIVADIPGCSGRTGAEFCPVVKIAAVVSATQIHILYRVRDAILVPVVVSAVFARGIVPFGRALIVNIPKVDPIFVMLRFMRD